MGSIQPLTKMGTKGFPWAARGANNSAVLVVSNVKVRMEAQHSIPFWVFMSCYGKAIVWNVHV